MSKVKYIIKQYHQGKCIAKSSVYDTLQEAEHYRLRMAVHRPERDYRIYRIEGEEEVYDQ